MNNKPQTMTKEEFTKLAVELCYRGYGKEIDWQRELKPCSHYHDFTMETIWVILNSGMKEQIARKIWSRILHAWHNGQETSTAFNHKGKVKAIDFVRANGHDLFEQYKVADNKIDFLKSIPFIGNITCYHLAKNLGFDCVKPDRHLVRIAKYYGTTPELLCKKLAEETGEKVATVDIILWRAANLGLFSHIKC